jgi:hypothetical protein
MQSERTARIETGPSSLSAATTSRNRPIKPDWAWIANRQERHPGSVFYLNGYEGGKRKRKVLLKKFEGPWLAPRPMIHSVYPGFSRGA